MALPGLFNRLKTMNSRVRPIVYSAIAIMVIWVAALAAYNRARNATVTADKVRAYVESTDLARLSGAERARAIDRLAAMLNGLSTEERQKAQIERTAGRWFQEMTEEEKAHFIEATMPTGFKQMLTAFEQLPEEKRRHAVDDALRRLKEAKAKVQTDGNIAGAPGTNGPVLSEELQAKIRAIGLKTFYSQSSAETKAELAPVLEELQRVMENGRVLRRP